MNGTLECEAVKTIAPSITSVDPTNGSINVAINKVIKITFSEAIKAGTAYNSITITNNGAVVSSITKSISGNVLTLTNSANYAIGTNSLINLPANSITDLAGNNITAFTSNFTTTPYSFSVAQIEAAASTVRSYIETYHKLPSTVNVSGTGSKHVPILRTLTTALLQINNGNSNTIPLRNFSSTYKPNRRHTCRKHL